ncbi:MAG: hypothetical protein N2C13_05395, partial [Chloroflexota bacterium]
MKSPDKFLIAIVVGIVALVLVVFAVTLARGAPEYKAHDNPEGGDFNYLQAIHNEDYKRAYSYLSSNLKD